jgi:hypothetical protein
VVAAVVWREQRLSEREIPTFIAGDTIVLRLHLEHAMNIEAVDASFTNLNQTEVEAPLWQVEIAGSAEL